MSTTADPGPLAADCPTCGVIVPRPLDVDRAGYTTCPRGHRVLVVRVVGP